MQKSPHLPSKQCSNDGARTALLVSGSPVGVSPAVLRELAACAGFILALDSGAEQLRAADLTPDLLLGDFDSIAPDTLAHFEALGVKVVRHNPHKDATDIELGIEALHACGYQHIIATNVLGGRTDHALGALGALAHAVQQKDMQVVLRDEHEVCFFIPSRAEEQVFSLSETRGRFPLSHFFETEGNVPLSHLSLISWGGAALVSIRGVEWELDHHVLSPYSSLGVSNEPRASCVTLRVHEGPGTILLFCESVDEVRVRHETHTLTSLSAANQHNQKVTSTPQRQ